MKKICKILTLSILGAAAVFLTVFSERATEYARDALKVCAISVVPSLFPYMVISSMLASGEGASLMGKILPVSRLYGLPGCASSAMILGALCGFPVGAKTALSMYKCGHLTKEQTEILISVANNTGPSFVVSVVGGAFFKSLLFGWLLYFYQLTASVISGLIINRLLLPCKHSAGSVQYTGGGKASFFSAVCDSCTSVVTICGFIVFFSVLCGFLIPFLSGVSDTFAGVITSLIEFTGGCRTASNIGGDEGRFLCGLAIGWSGISVFCQTAAFCAPEGISLSRCVCTKALQGVLTGLLACIPITETPAHTGAFPKLYDEVFLLLRSPMPCALISAVLYVFLIKKLIISHKL